MIYKTHIFKDHFIHRKQNGGELIVNPMVPLQTKNLPILQRSNIQVLWRFVILVMWTNTKTRLKEFPLTPTVSFRHLGAFSRVIQYGWYNFHHVVHAQNW